MDDTTDHLPKVPPEYLPRLNELLFKKRPFGFNLSSRILLAYIERWASLADLAADFSLLLNFDGDMLEVQGNTFRTVSEWKETCSEKTEESDA